MKRRHMEIRVAAMLGIVASTAMAAEAPRISKADNYPHKSLRVIDPFAAAGASDVIARLVGQKFTERFGEAFVIDNRPGAGGNVAAKMAAEAPADGYTLMNVVALIAQRFHTDVCSAYLLEPDRSRLVLAATLGLTETIRAIPIVTPEAVHTIGLVVAARDPATPLTTALVAEARRLAKVLDDE